jgi:lysyl-tRNA synthetase class II
MASNTKHRKNHKQKVAARNARIETAKRQQQKAINAYIEQLQKQFEEQRLKEQAEDEATPMVEPEATQLLPKAKRVSKKLIKDQITIEPEAKA